MSIEAYSVSLKLKFIDGVSAGLIGLSTHFGALNRHIGTTQTGLIAVEDRMKRIRSLGLVGAGLTGAGIAGLSLFKGPIEEAAKFNQQIAKFQQFGLSAAVNAEAVGFAKSMNIIGTSATEAMRHVNEAQGLFREGGLPGSAALAGAKLAAPFLAKIDFATEALDDESKARMRGSGLASQRFIEMRGGLQSATKYAEIGDAAWKAIQTSGGNVSWEQYRQFMARGGVAAQGLSNEALFGKLEPIIGELKGSTAGTALSTAYNRLVGGVRVPNQVAHAFVDAGIWDPRQIVWNKMGGIKTFKGNPLGKEKMELLSSDPTAFYDKYVMPGYEERHLSFAERARDNLIRFGRTGGNLFTLYDRQRAVSQRSVEAQRNALGLDASVAVAAKTLQGKTIDMHAKWANLMNELGTTVLPLAVSALEKFTNAIKGLTEVASAHPTAAKVGEYGVLGLTGLSALGGVSILAKAGWNALGGLGLGRAAVAAGGAVLGLVSLPELAVAGGTMAAGYGLFKAGEKGVDWYKHRNDRPVVNVQVHNKLDKNGLTTAITQEQAKGANRPQTGISSHDIRQAIPAAGMVGGG